jgi:hypothetical protein
LGLGLGLGMGLGLGLGLRLGLGLGMGVRGSQVSMPRRCWSRAERRPSPRSTRCHRAAFSRQVSTAAAAMWCRQRRAVVSQAW